MIPPELFCPRCGRKLHVQEITDAEAVKQLATYNFRGAGKFVCVCGVVGLVYMRNMPDKPTFTVTFDIYNVTQKQENVGG